MFCNQCGEQIAGNSKFCGSCGAALSAQIVSQVSPQRQNTVAQQFISSFTTNRVANQRIAIAVAGGAGTIGSFLSWSEGLLGVDFIPGNLKGGSLLLFIIILLVTLTGAKERILSIGKRDSVAVCAGFLALIGGSAIAKANPFAGMGSYVVFVSGVVICIFAFVFKD